MSNGAGPRSRTRSCAVAARLGPLGRQQRVGRPPVPPPPRRLRQSDEQVGAARASVAAGGDDPAVALDQQVAVTLAVRLGADGPRPLLVEHAGHPVPGGLDAGRDALGRVEPEPGRLAVDAPREPDLGLGAQRHGRLDARRRARARPGRSRRPPAGRRGPPAGGASWASASAHVPPRTARSRTSSVTTSAVRVQHAVGRVGPLEPRRQALGLRPQAPPDAPRQPLRLGAPRPRAVRRPQPQRPRRLLRPVPGHAGRRVDAPRPPNAPRQLARPSALSPVEVSVPRTSGPPAGRRPRPGWPSRPP